ncbi:hypothetical protein PG996_012865 [Apiospora saccharicola]|uniref:Uncharacterized protein n=1 Tax=Apiospora saccharicola TaxID=335842 RepID=A0ABR1U3T8_9PEZI
MPPANFAEIADTIAFVGLGAGAIGGSVIQYCSDYPSNYGCVGEKRGIAGLTDDQLGQLSCRAQRENRSLD